MTADLSDEVRGVDTLARYRGCARIASILTTTIKVSDELRERLEEQAARDRLTLGAHLAHLADAEDRRWRLHLLKSAIDASSSGDAGSYAAETRDRERTELADAS